MYIDLRPGQIAIQKTAEVVYSVGVGELGWQYGTGLKSHGAVTNWCTRRGWPVNCMTVISVRWWSKHAIPKTAEVAYSVGHLWEEIEWVLNYYITQCTGNSITLEIRELEKWCCRENSTRQKGPSGPPIEQLRIRRVGDRCGRENQHPERLGPQSSGWAAQENRKETLMAIRVGVNMLQFCSVSNSLLHTTLSNKVRVFTNLSMLYIDLRPSRTVKIGNAPV